MNTAPKQNNGFTLIELLVVMAIIGILSAVVLTSLNGARQKGRDARRISDVKQIQLALELYYDSTGAYPLTIGTAASSLLVSNGYIASLPLDPSNNAVYSYSPYSSSLNGGAQAAICSGYHIGASLESGITHTVLQTDADVTTLTPIAGTPPTGGEADQKVVGISMQVCTGGTADFHGADTQKCNPAGDIGTACYDVRS